MSFSIEYDKQPQKFLNKLDRHLADRILTKLDKTLPNNPVPQDTVAIVGEHGIFRYRIGDYRILYRVNYQENKIVIIKIDKRSRVYD